MLNIGQKKGGGRMKDYVIDILQAIVPSEVANKIWKKKHSLTIYLQDGEKAVVKTRKID